MLVDGRTLADGSTLEAQVCVIGGGPAGIAVAMRLAATGREVLLVESGGASEAPETAALTTGDFTGRPLIGALGFPVTVGDVGHRLLGGNTVTWAGHAQPLTPLDLAARPYQPYGGWPFTAADLEPWYLEAHDFLRRGPFDYDPATWSAAGGLGPPPDLGPTMTTIMSQQWLHNVATTHQATLNASTAITVVHDLSVTSLHASPAGDHVVSATARTLTGLEHTVVADHVVVATGGIQTPRLLLASDDVVTAGLGNEQDQVGRYYADHIKTAGLVGVLQSPMDDLVFNPGLHIVPTQTPSGESTSVLLAAFAAYDESYRTSEGVPSAMFGTVVEDLADTATAASGLGAAHASELLRLGASGSPVQALGAGLLMEQILDPDSRVRLSTTQVDLLGMPAFEVDWRVSATDVANMGAACRHFAEVLAAQRIARAQLASGWFSFADPLVPDTLLGNLVVTPQGQVPTDIPVETAYHQMCSTRMSADPATGVVDTDCRVHTVDNLWIAGSSVFPAPSGSFPTLTLVALAHRLAAHLDEAVLP